MKDTGVWWATHLLWTAALVGVGVSLTSVFPGLTSEFPFLLVLPVFLCFSFVAAGVLPLVVMTFRMDERRAADAAKAEDFGEITRPRPWWLGLRAPAVTLVIVVVLLTTGAPVRLAFHLSRREFEREVAKAPIVGFSPDPLERRSDAYRVVRQVAEPLERRLGIYWVDRYAADPRGGVYFRTFAGMDGIGPDTMSHGFAYRPNREGSPFGRARYSLLHLEGDWYVFAASNDW